MKTRSGKGQGQVKETIKTESRIVSLLILLCEVTPTGKNDLESGCHDVVALGYIITSSIIVFNVLDKTGYYHERDGLKSIT